MARAIFIDATNREVREVTLPDVAPGASYGDNLKAMYRMIGCDLVCSGGHLDNGDRLFVDDEGLLKERNANTPWFALNGITRPLCGNAVLVGDETPDGGTSDVKSTVDEIKDLVIFLLEHMVAKWAGQFDENPFRVTVAFNGEPPKAVYAPVLHGKTNSPDQT